jgi:hypothetical protein
MLRTKGLLVLTLATAATATASQAQDTSATADSSETYVTLDGYGLGRIVQGSITNATTRAKAVMVKMKIVEEPGPSLGTRKLGLGWQERRGKKGLLDVSIRLKSESPSTTRVEVNARSGPTAWDKGFEEQLLDALGKT